MKRINMIINGNYQKLCQCCGRFALLVVLFLNPLWALAQDPITDLSSIAVDPTGSYIINSDINATGFSTIATFSGTLEAAINPQTKMPYRIQNLSAPLFTTLTGTVKNLVIENVSISSGTNVGAIACTAEGSARIYNVGILAGSVSGSNYVGGLVGLLDGTARVVNCYSYADITGGSEKAGIVGYNNYASKYDDLKTMVMNCMFYGNIAVGGTISPIYGGYEISNESSSRLNNYNYYLYEAPFSFNNTTQTPIFSKYNRALAAEERYLVRWEFYRYLVNSTRELASWYVFGSVQTDAQTKLLKWVLDKSIAKYPILKEQGKYPSVVNYDPDYTNDPETGAKIARTSSTLGVNQGKDLGTTVTVTISGTQTSGGQTWPADAAITQTTPLTLHCIDKDIANYNFNYNKIQLPYYNDVGTGNYTHNRVVTGWKITSITAVAGDPYTSAHYTGANYDFPYYNFADRKSSNKDLYTVSGRVFSQGAYFDVPDGVTAITIEPYWACAAYLSDDGYDAYYSGSGTSSYSVNSTTGIFGTRYTNGTSTFNGSDQLVYTTMGNALSRLDGLGRSTSTSIYDYAVVLVGNYHMKGMPENTEKHFTVMSVDFNQDNEPDYSLITHSGKQEKVSPMRFDFINVPNAAMAHKITNYTYMGIVGNIKPKGWFETTNTTTIRFSQYEYDSENKSLNEPLILMGGLIDMFTSTNGNEGSTTHTKYILVGGNVWFQVFNNGCHMDKKTTQTPHRPISVCGGDYDKFYLSGYLRPEASAWTPEDGGKNAECYISGGRFGEVAGAGYEPIAGDVTWQIYDADMESFYGGGINDNKPVAGNITTVIRGSRVGSFCGGPKFGNMSDNTSVQTTASDCTFGTFFGAGYGGTAFARKNVYNHYQTLNYNWNGSTENEYIAPKFTRTDQDHHRGTYKSDLGISVNYDYKNFEGSNVKTVGYLFVNYASLSLALTHDVTSSLTDCTITNNFYGGGSLGKVEGDVESILINCTVGENVFGAGYSVNIPTVNVFPDGDDGLFQRIPFYNPTTGVFEKGIYPNPVIYTWDNAGSTSSPFTDNGDTHLIYTNVDFDDLGTVSGNATLTIKGNSSVGGSVYGGGDESAVTKNGSGEKGNTIVILQGDTNVGGNVYGGGNEGPVEGDSSVTIETEPQNP